MRFCFFFPPLFWIRSESVLQCEMKAIYLKCEPGATASDVDVS